MTGPEPKADLHRYLQAARDALLWKLDGLSEYDIRRPLTPTGTNLLGLIKVVTWPAASWATSETPSYGVRRAAALVQR